MTDRTVPDKEGAFIDRRKLYGYLLSTKHPVGQAKARVFAGCGYHAEDADRLAEELKRLLVEGHLVAVVESSYGPKYIVEGTIRCAHGGLLTLRTVWIRETDDAAPRFVTAYPA